jgi:hypothetical protein
MRKVILLYPLVFLLSKYLPKGINRITFLMYTQSKLIKKKYFESRNTKGYNRITFFMYAQSQNYLKKNILRAGIPKGVFLLSKYIFLLVLTLSVHEKGYSVYTLWYSCSQNIFFYCTLSQN